jgi:RND family efflux transporter MFP subunit
MGQSRWGPRLRFLAIGALGVVILAGGLVAGVLPRLRQTREVNAEATATASAAPRVTVAVSRRSTSAAERVLPGNSLPLLEASLYARATGYVKSRLVDIGDRVQAGQVLAVIAAPDLDDQLLQARANLIQAKANLTKAKADETFARTDLLRYRHLMETRAVAQEEYDTRVQAFGVAQAVVGAMDAAIKVNEAAVQRYADLQGFEKITAPFPGVITARHIDPGDLTSADSTARELFHLMRTDTLRVFVNVPQVFSTGIQVGQSATVYRQEDPTKNYAGKVTRTADALDPNTRTLLSEVQVPNPDNALRPGMFLQVNFVFDSSILPVLIPSAALATRTDGPRVAVLDSEHRVRYRSVQIGRDYGAEIEITAGLDDGETVVVHPGDDIPEGTVVEPVMPKG